jgi:cbb3-type cytochrome oxidase subunit 1
VVVALIALLSGINKGREYGELPWISDFLIAIALIIFLILLSQSLKGKENLQVPTRYAIISGAGILAVHVFGNLSLPYGPLSSAIYFNGMQDAAVQEFYRMGVLGFFILMPAFMMLYYFVPNYYRVPLYSTKMADFQAVTTLTMTALAGGVGLVFSTADSVMQTVGIVANAALTVSVIAGVVNINQTITRSDTPLRSDSTSNLFRIGTLFILILSLFRGVGGIRMFQERFGYTWWNFLDLSLDANSYTLLISFAGAYLMIQNMRGQAISGSGINLHLMLALAGTSLVIISNLIQGSLSYYHLKALAEDGSFQYGWSEAIGLANAEGNPALLGLRAIGYIGYAILSVSVLIAFLNSIAPLRSTDRPYTEPSLRA